MFKSFIASADENAKTLTGEEFWDLKNAHKLYTGETLNMIRKLSKELICFIRPNGKDTY